MAWLFLAAGGQFVNAVVAILDKYIVSDERVLPRPFVYAFYSCLITGGWAFIYALALIPGAAALGVPSLANVEVPSIEVVAMSFLAAYTFFMALVSMYDGLKRADASVVMPVIGAVATTASFAMNAVFLDTWLAGHYVWGIALLVLGTLLVAQALPHRSVFLQVTHSGIFFALHYIAMKGLFSETSFDDGFFWSRVAFVLFALSLLMVPAYLEKIKSQTKGTTRKAGALVIFTKVLAGIAAFMLLKATDWGDVAVVQATDALKFALILVIGVLFHQWIPETAGECEVRPQRIVQRVLSVAVIVIGYFVLFLGL